ncbi:alpha-ribazole phosphatase [Parabacteroides sp. PF5-9]|uniref:alpha-ribazole phosphatase n=1 Tax=Parabacteroides sp. PF5-9 TaxID=1742404 RepID=UPI0024764B75|nr:alpha-ribazole phosphatase [Parabacteroides sp. PF5-9]MDH6357374.1 alpha-ribazole phosphatase [Parabacteroides sp. PF5-9]
MEIYLVRHTSVDVPIGYTYGQTDVPLKPTFEEEAAVVQSNLSGLSFDRVWTSPLSRCVRLATYCGYGDAHREDRIKEINFGDWEMRSWDELSNDPASDVFFKDWINTSSPNGESMMDLFNRVSEFLNELKASAYNRVCLFAHGGVLTCARIYAGEYEMKEAFDRMPSYGEVIKIDI